MNYCGGKALFYFIKCKVAWAIPIYSLPNGLLPPPPVFSKETKVGVLGGGGGEGEGGQLEQFSTWTYVCIYTFPHT